MNVICKNVPRLDVKIFEFNTLTYYKKNLTEFDIDLELDGLMPSIQQEHTWDFKNNIKHTEKFDFPQLTGKVGLFIVEFVGNGVKARAVIRKGKLSLVQRETVAGHLCYILDYRNKICTGNTGAGVIFQNKLYEADKATGRIFVPYGLEQLEGKCILVNDDFAQLTHFSQNIESYALWANFFMNDQSAMLGKSA